MSGTGAALEAGWDAVLELPDPEAQWAILKSVRREEAGRFWLVVVPDMNHPLVRDARRRGGGARVAHIVPDMSDGARRDVGIALRGGQVDWLFVTVERFSQAKFVQFMAELKPAALVIASAQRGMPDARDGWTPYCALPALRGLVPALPILALVDGGESVSGLGAWLNLRENTAVEKAPPPVAPPPARKEPVAKPEPSPWDPAYPCFDKEMSLSEVAEHLGRDVSWCAEALVHYIRSAGRTHPFPWVARPVYLAVAMAAGQTESTDPRIVLPILGDRATPIDARIALAALANRSAPARPGRGPSDG